VTYGDTPTQMITTMPAQRNPLIGQPIEVFPVSRRGYTVLVAACELYEAALSSGVDLDEATLRRLLSPAMGSALSRTLDACHDLLER